jgi:2-polyprenyl-3-methyl-5-hydroxy-6-metoxy-1,4-benzoquinol methylase
MPHANSDRTGSVCPVCGGRNLSSFFDASNVPVRDGALFDTRRQAASAPTGRMRLSLCTTCLYIWNDRYDARKVRLDRYDFSLQHSPSFRRFVEGVCAQLIERHGLQGKRVLDVGCGDALFLKTICAMGGNVGVGIEPAFVPTIGPGDPITIVRERFAAGSASRSAFDLIACRHVLSEVANARPLLRSIGDVLRKQGGRLYLEVPNAAHTLRRRMFWNLVYEHRSWFLPEALATICSSAGLVSSDARTWLGGEYISVMARPGASARVRVRADRRSVARWLTRLANFRGDWETTVERWQHTIDRWRRAGTHVVAWGAGARAVTFLAAFETAVDAIVDINPQRWGKYLPVSAVRVEPPQFIIKARPDVVLITNPTYAPEIQSEVKRLGVRCRFARL